MRYASRKAWGVLWARASSLIALKASSVATPNRASAAQSPKGIKCIVTVIWGMKLVTLSKMHAERLTERGTL